MRTLMYSILMPGLCLLFAQCQSDDTVSAESLLANAVDITVMGETLIINNQSGHSISYFAVEAEYAARIDWAPISQDSHTIADGQLKDIPWSEIVPAATVKSGDEIIVYWWPTQPGIAKSEELQYRNIKL